MYVPRFPFPVHELILRVWGKGCYPFQTHDPFVIPPGACPHVFFAGNQPRFETCVVYGDGADEQEGEERAEETRVRLIAVPGFKETGEVVLVDLEDLEVEVLRVGVEMGQAAGEAG